MDASFVAVNAATDEALPSFPFPSATVPFPPSSHRDTSRNTKQPVVARVPPQLSNPAEESITVPSEYITRDDQTKNSENSTENCRVTRRKTLSNATPYARFAAHEATAVHRNDISNGSGGCHPAGKVASSLRSMSSPQLTTKPLTRSKVYRKASLKSSLSKTSSFSERCDLATGRSPATCVVDISNYNSSTPMEPKEAGDPAKGKWNADDVRITCNPLSTPYPYSTPCAAAKAQVAPAPDAQDAQDDEPKGRSCGSFLPILSLIPQTVISFQYLSPKMKFSWWRNKIS